MRRVKSKALVLATILGYCMLTCQPLSAQARPYRITSASASSDGVLSFKFDNGKEYAATLPDTSSDPNPAAYLRPLGETFYVDHAQNFRIYGLNEWQNFRRHLNDGLRAYLNQNGYKAAVPLMVKIGQMNYLSKPDQTGQLHWQADAGRVSSRQFFDLKLDQIKLLTAQALGEAKADAAVFQLGASFELKQPAALIVYPDKKDVLFLFFDDQTTHELYYKACVAGGLELDSVMLPSRVRPEPLGWLELLLG